VPGGGDGKEREERTAAEGTGGRARKREDSLRGDRTEGKEREARESGGEREEREEDEAHER